MDLEKVLVILVGVLVAAAVVLAIILIVVRRRQDREDLEEWGQDCGETWQETPTPPPPPHDPPGSGAAGTQGPGGQARFTLRLSDPRDHARGWVLHLAGEALIGRGDQCQVQLMDLTVSREQCKLALWGEGVALIPLSATNPTFCGGQRVEGARPLRPGDLLEFGGAALRVDYIQPLAPQNPAGGTRQGRQGMTESIF